MAEEGRVATISAVDVIDPGVERVQHASVLVGALLVLVFIAFTVRALATRKKRDAEWNALGGEGDKLSGTSKRPPKSDD